MDIKITVSADPVLQAALEKLASSLASGIPPFVVVSSPAPEAPKTTTEPEAPAEPAEPVAPVPTEEEMPWKEEAPTEPEPAPAKKAKKPTKKEIEELREQITHQAVTLLQAGHRDDVKSMLEGFGVSRISDVQEENLQECFEALGRIANG